MLEHLVEPDNVEPALTELDLGQLSFPKARRVWRAQPVTTTSVPSTDQPREVEKTDERPSPASNVQQSATARRQILTELTQLTFEVPLTARIGNAFVWSVIRRSVDRGRQLLENRPGTLELKAAGTGSGRGGAPGNRSRTYGVTCGRAGTRRPLAQKANARPPRAHDRTAIRLTQDVAC